MRTCERCGLRADQLCDDGAGCKADAAKLANDDAGPYGGDWSEHIVSCRDRELSNLRSLLRSVTRRLENAREMLETYSSVDGVSFQVKFAEDIDTDRLKSELDAVLEVLS